MAKPKQFDQTLFISFGGGAYWGASILFLTAWRPQSTMIDEIGFAPSAVAWFLIALLIGIAALLHKQLMKARAQIVLAAAGLITAAAYAALLLVDIPGLSNAPVQMLMNASHHAFLIVFWGLAYTSLSKQDAERAVVLSVLGAFLIYFLGMLIPVGTYGASAAALLRAIGVIPFLLKFATIPTLERTITPESLRFFAPFYLSRAFLGICMAPLFYFAASSLMPSDARPSSLFCMVGALIAGLALALVISRKKTDASFLRVAPLVLLGAIALPFAFPASTLFAAFPILAASIVWISWIALSATQLSDLKEQIGLDEAFLAISEKAVVITVIFLGFSLCGLLELAFGKEALQEFVMPTTLVLTYAGLTVCTYLFATLVDRKRQQRFAKRAILRTDEQLRIVHDAIAQKYALTQREQDVFMLMAKGHTRPHICKELFISDATVKTHSHHVYEKLDIHSRDELYELVESERKRLVHNEDEKELLL